MFTTTIPRRLSASRKLGQSEGSSISLVPGFTLTSSDADIALQLQIAETRPVLHAEETTNIHPQPRRVPDRNASYSPRSNDRKLAEELQSLEDESAALVFLGQDMQTLELIRRKENARKSPILCSTSNSASSCPTSERNSCCRNDPARAHPTETSPAGERMGRDSSTLGRMVYLRDYRDPALPHNLQANSSHSADLESIKTSFAEYLERSSALRAQRRESFTTTNDRRSQDRLLDLDIDEALPPSHIRRDFFGLDNEESAPAIAPVQSSVNLDFDLTLDWADVQLGRGGGREWELSGEEWELGSVQQFLSNSPPSRLPHWPIHRGGIPISDTLPGDETYEELLALSDIIGPAKQIGASEAELDRLPCKRVVIRTNRTNRPNDPPKRCPLRNSDEQLGRKGKHPTLFDINKRISRIPIRTSVSLKCNNSERTVNNGNDIFVSLGSTCSICLVEYDNEDSAIVLAGCEHIFHAECLKQWLRTKKSCPIDRQTVTMNSFTST